MNTDSPVADFTEADIKKKFHWLIDNGLTIEKAAQAIKEQTDISSVIKYIDNYLKQEKK